MNDAAAFYNKGRVEREGNLEIGQPIMKTVYCLFVRSSPMLREEGISIDWKGMMS
ncbi:hypothetical protein L3476_17195 [Paenibacillus thiaminolyticus]|uniref:hypothetical protein n=1 Tax=Paenibacillus thiaminolyticus TaxID=49283 RepID=UPI0013F5BB6C|nr:hypothetical protein [Paenibacillus thiaminolyticus]NGP61358.1 hypothetical protein [Paenibacillus thiaminolyticus]WCR25103.1 hypothetical protein L3476_17195 [Paenibacillus thiaminolyticus]